MDNQLKFFYRTWYVRQSGSFPRRKARNPGMDETLGLNEEAHLATAHKGVARDVGRTACRRKRGLLGRLEPFDL